MGRKNRGAGLCNSYSEERAQEEDCRTHWSNGESCMSSPSEASRPSRGSLPSKMGAETAVLTTWHSNRCLPLAEGAAGPRSSPAQQTSHFSVLRGAQCLIHSPVMLSTLSQLQCKRQRNRHRNSEALQSLSQQMRCFIPTHDFEAEDCC